MNRERSLWSMQDSIDCKAIGQDYSVYKAAPKMYEALRQITLIEPKSILAECAYQGIPPKKWVKETAPYYDGFNKALEQICQMIKPVLAEVEGKEEEDVCTLGNTK